MKTALCLATLLLITNVAHAYIPKIKTILKHTVERNGGDKALIVERIVKIKDQNLAAKETWYIANEGKMKVRVGSPKSARQNWQFEILYTPGQRMTRTSKGAIKTFPWSVEFFEPLLHTRSTESLAKELVRVKALPGWGEKFINEEEPPSQNTLVRLDRYDGGISYVLGPKKENNGSQAWILQDGFDLLKLTMASDVSVRFKDYRDHDESERRALSLPEQQIVGWPASAVEIKTTSVKVVKLKEIKDQFQLDRSLKTQLPKEKIFKEFYSRFR